MDYTVTVTLDYMDIATIKRLASDEAERADRLQHESRALGLLEDEPTRRLLAERAARLRDLVKRLEEISESPAPCNGAEPLERSVEINEAAPPEPSTAEEKPVPAWDFETPGTGVIRFRYRDLNARMKGIECFRMVADLEAGTLRWATDVGLVTDDGWTARDIRAAARHCATKGELPRGTFLLDIEKGVSVGARASYAFGRLGLRTADGKTAIAFGEECGWVHKGVRREDGRYVHVVEELATKRRVKLVSA